MRVSHPSRIALLSAAPLVAAATAACGGGDPAASDSPGAAATGGTRPLRVMMFPAQAYRLPVMIAEKHGMFQKRDIEIEIIELLQERPESAKVFCDAVDEALTFIDDPADLAASASVPAADTGVSPEVANLVVEQAYKDFSTTLDKETLTRTFDMFVDLGIAKAEPRPNHDEPVAASRQGAIHG
ncbi:hypothetical protein ACQP1K_16515 [Sphaerimonospora sp. CA-214678]|uniref:hypothetical protein n=1 Tax=Sphaerimonospora sp. CA-214678 TaxID=3240029 RepID=UPI003D8F960F